MVVNRYNNGKLKISNDALKTMNECRQKTIENQKEYCGVLLGREIIKTSDIIIDIITEPSPRDIQKKFYFFRDNKYHQKKIIEVWKKSEGTCNYLGEWHTHLEDIPTPSPTDVKEWKKALKKFKFDGNELFFIIVGLKEISVWEGNKTDLSINKLNDYHNFDNLI